MRRHAANLLGVILALVTGGLPACSRAPDAGGEPAAATPAARSEVERGPIKVVVELDPAEPRLSDEPTLTLTVDAESQVDVELPPFGDSVGGFLVRSLNEPLAEIVAGRRVLRRVYGLEPVRTGTHVIRPIPVTFRDTRPGGDGEEHTLATEEFEVEVTSMLAGEAPTLADLKPAAAPLTIPVETEPPWTALIVAGGLVLAGAVVWLLVRRWRRRQPQEQPLTPAEEALAEFRRLLADDPLARGELQTFFVELTGIVRRFIERTTGVRAPELTTGEFLREMRGHAAFDAGARERLVAFLEAADLVKFAALRPARADIEESFRRAQEFVGLPGTLALVRERVA